MSVVAVGLLVNWSSDRSCTRGMIHNKLSLISPGCPRPCIALQLSNRGLQHHSVSFWHDNIHVHVSISLWKDKAATNFLPSFSPAISSLHRAGTDFLTMWTSGTKQQNVSAFMNSRNPREITPRCACRKPQARHVC